jgi:hypothetical protein
LAAICAGRSPAVFDDDGARAMGRAFDAALALFGEKFQPLVIHEVIARRRRIITAARKAGATRSGAAIER